MPDADGATLPSRRPSEFSSGRIHRRKAGIRSAISRIRRRDDHGSTPGIDDSLSSTATVTLTPRSHHAHESSVDDTTSPRVIESVVAACGGPAYGATTPVASKPLLTVAADWNLVSVQAWTQLEANPDAVLSPHPEARSLAMANAVIHDVMNAIDACYAPSAYTASQPGASPDAAVAQAAHDVLVGDPQMGATYPSGSEVPFLDAALATDLAKVADENAMSRVWLGYHFPKATVDGEALGISIGITSRPTRSHRRIERWERRSWQQDRRLP